MAKMSISQPCFFPWLGYFNRIHWADKHVFLDSVFFRRQDFFHRAKLMSDTWLTLPVSRMGQRMNIADCSLSGSRSDWQQSMTNTFCDLYKTAPYFDEANNLLHQAISVESHHFADFSLRSIELVIAAFGWTRQLERASDVPLPATSDASARLALLCLTDGCDSYIAGDGSREYLDLQPFGQYGVNVVWQSDLWTPPPYLSWLTQSEQIPGLSILDVIASVGIDGAAKLAAGVPC